MLLIASFTLTAVSFLGYALLAAGRGQVTRTHGDKSFFYSTGLAEGAETIAAFCLMVMMPDHFPAIASIYAGLCVITFTQRSLAAWLAFR
jgi:hypothetical protein